MQVGVRWDSLYRYSEAVRLLHTELRVLPADAFGQRRLSSSLQLEPQAQAQQLLDAFGNEYHHVDFLDDVEEIHVTVEAEVETAESAVPEPGISPLMRHLLLDETVRSPFEPTILELAQAVPEDLDPVATGEAVCRLLNDRFDFEVGPTDVSSTALDLIRLGSGVCQDFTHLMLAILRMHGIPARYVSGYLAPIEGEEVGEATHAWVQLLAPDGWHGFDPSNNAPQDGRYVVIAVGRDYDDISPLRGAYSGVANEHWSAVVRVRSTASDQEQQ
ncbi:MAG: transglutaminase family protein [Chloroflexi bacterium]|nr:transglutaminase family protein [Chloroflexota bacterium]